MRRGLPYSQPWRSVEIDYIEGNVEGKNHLGSKIDAIRIYYRKGMRTTETYGVKQQTNLRFDNKGKREIEREREVIYLKTVSSFVKIIYS